MHLALDPRSNINLLGTLAKDEPELLCQKLSSIIQLLAAKGANPNLIPDGNNRQPAMAAGNASGYGDLPKEIVAALRVQLVLVGACPFTPGTNYAPLVNSSNNPYPKDSHLHFWKNDAPGRDIDKVLNEVGSVFTNADQTNKESLAKTLHPSVMRFIRKYNIVKNWGFFAAEDLKPVDNTYKRFGIR